MDPGKSGALMITTTFELLIVLVSMFVLVLAFFSDMDGF